ncbi:MAG TPA: sulfotransferase [Acidimicrobiales bacterium]|nr:sulfotransferase [Acidimicrobiales bacterium]
MGLKVIGAGLGRTGTHSLQLALQQLLGGPCYHMLEVMADPDVRVQQWMDAMDGNADWDGIMKGYVASVDWPAAAFWRELADAYPDAFVLLSTRASTEEWFTSFSSTIMQVMLRDAPNGDSPMPLRLMYQRFTPDWKTADACKAAYEQHNADVRATVPAERLIEWQPGDGWGPLCAKLGVPVPSVPFPHVNTTDDFRAMLGL